MSLNKYEPHLYVIPEDDADRQIAHGFLLHHSVDQRRVRVMPPPGGWSRVRDTFVDEYVPLLRTYLHAHVVLVVDFDGNPESRRAEIESPIPVDLRERVFVVGPKTNPENLRRSRSQGYESIGKDLAADCYWNTAAMWEHAELQDNEAERLRLVETVRPFIFS